MSARQLQIDIDTATDISVIRLNGVIDSSNVDEFKSTMDELSQASGATVFLDCTRLAYVNSTSLGLFFQFHRYCEAHDGQLAIYGLSKKIQNIMRILGLEGVLNIYGSREEAEAHVTKGQSAGAS